MVSVQKPCANACCLTDTLTSDQERCLERCDTVASNQKCVVVTLITRLQCVQIFLTQTSEHLDNSRWKLTEGGSLYNSSIQSDNLMPHIFANEGGVLKSQSQCKEDSPLGRNYLQDAYTVHINACGTQTISRHAGKHPMTVETCSLRKMDGQKNE